MGLVKPDGLKCRTMGNKHKAKGTSFETAIREYLNAKGFVHARRTALEGGQDKGDIHGVERPSTLRKACFQCKNQKALKLSEWLNDTVEQAERLDGALPILIAKRAGKGKKALGDSYAVMRLDDLIELLQEAGYL